MKKWIKAIGIGVMVVMACCIFTGVNGTTVKAATNVQMSENQAYYYDLNGDGVKEKIVYKTVTDKKDKDRFGRINLFINDKKVYSKKITDDIARYFIVDLNNKDKTVELNLQACGPSFVLDYSSFQHWDGKKITEFETNKNKALDYLRGYSIVGIKENGNFSIGVDTPFDVAIGNYYTTIPLKYKNGKITATKKTYYLSRESRKYVYKTKKSLKAYKKASRKSKAFTIKKGQKLNVIKIKTQKNVSQRQRDKYGDFKSVDAFIYVKTKNGKKGWIFISKNTSSWDNTSIFKQVPGWA